jgi:pSer/pThr/pTyr-binding forkhead associated (FHA) protein
MATGIARHGPADSRQATAVAYFLVGQDRTSDRLQFTPIDEDRFTIGRHPQNKLRLEDATVSGYHAEILLAGNVCVLRDLGSRNGHS